MRKIMKRNQIMITALALMIAVAGYLHFSGKNQTDKEADAIQAGIDDAAENITYEISDQDMENLMAGEIDSLEEDAVMTENYLDEQIPVEQDLGNETAAETSDTDITIEENPGEAVFTSTGAINTFSGAKLLKEQTRAKNKETLLDIINNTNISEEQKKDAITGMIELTDFAEKEMSAEILLEAKGFGDAVVSISEGSVDVFVFAYELSESERAQIEDIVKRKTEISAENIVITPVDE